MNNKRESILILIIFFLFFTGCSKQKAPDINFDESQKEIEKLTFELFGLISTGKENEAYNTLLHQKVKGNVTKKKFKDVLQIIDSKLGKLKKLDFNRSNFDKYNGSWLVRVIYIGTFENGRGDITISALYDNAQWKLMSFNVNSPLLSENPDEYRRKIEIYVTESDFVKPGIDAKIIDISDGKEKVIVQNTKVQSVRWKIKASKKREGFVTVVVSEGEEKLIKNANKLSVKYIK